MRILIFDDSGDLELKQINILVLLQLISDCFKMGFGHVEVISLRASCSAHFSDARGEQSPPKLFASHEQNPRHNVH